MKEELPLKVRIELLKVRLEVRERAHHLSSSILQLHEMHAELFLLVSRELGAGSAAVRDSNARLESFAEQLEHQRAVLREQAADLSELRSLIASLQP